MVKVAGETGLLHKLPHPTWGSGRHLSGPVGPHGLKVGGRMVSPAFPKSLKEEKNCPGLQASAFPSAEWAEGPRSSGPWDSDLRRDPVA